MHKVIFPDWRSLPIGRGWSDTFVFPISAYDGLPPMRRAKMLRDMANKVAKIRRSASIWIPVDGPDGIWFRREVQRSLQGLVLPYAVTPVSVECPQLADFSFIPWTDRVATPAPPEAPSLLIADKLNQHELGCLHVLARIRSASTAEVASLTGCSLPTARQALRGLMGDRFALLDTDAPFPVWELTRRGKSLSLRSWGAPKGVSFPGYKERELKPGRHRRTTRLWLTWLRNAWPQAEIWAGWSEVTFGRCWPDALVWGKLDGFETLFWLEVESGHRSRQEIMRITRRRLNQAMCYSKRFPLRLVFVVLSQKWAQPVLSGISQNLSHDVSVVIGEWGTFGELALPRWGSVSW
jgi:hypothetical protein